MARAIRDLSVEEDLRHVPRRAVWMKGTWNFTAANDAERGGTIDSFTK